MSGKPRDGRSYTNVQAAGMLGIDPATVKRWRARGWLVNRPDGHLDVAATRARVNADRDPTLGGRADRGAGGAAPVSGDGARLLKARAMRETLAAKLLQIEIDKEEGRLIDREVAERVFLDVITEARTRMEAIPARVASRLVSLSDARAIQDILRDEIETALRSVARLPDIRDGEEGGAA